MPVGEEQQLRAAVDLAGPDYLVVFLELVLIAHPQGLRRYLLEVPLPGQEDVHRTQLHRLLRNVRGFLHVVEEHRAAGLTVFLGDLPQLVDYQLVDAVFIAEDILHVGDLLFKVGGLLGALEDIFAVDVAQLDFSNVLRLHLVDAEPYHQVGNYLGFLVGLADKLYRIVDVEQYLLETVEQVELFLLLFQVEGYAALYAVPAEYRPLVQYLVNAHYAGSSVYQHVEVAVEVIL